MMDKIYTGIGSRETPPEVLDSMEEMAIQLAKMGWVLRSGGAPGADQAFEEGSALADWDLREIFLPWPNFEADAREPYRNKDKEFPFPTQEAHVVAAEHHPRWRYLSQGAQKLHARNVHQIMGIDLLTPTSFVICYTVGGKGGGGTGQALRISNAYDVPVIDLGGMSFEDAVRVIGEIVD